MRSVFITKKTVKAGLNFYKVVAINGNDADKMFNLFLNDVESTSILLKEFKTIIGGPQEGITIDFAEYPEIGVGKNLAKIQV